MTVPTRFGVLRLLATLLKVIAWIILIGSILGALGVGVLGSLLQQTWFDATFVPALLLDGTSGMIVGAVLIAGGILTFLSLFAAAESIQVQLAIEENTRLTAALLLRSDEQNRPAVRPTPTYYGEVVDE
ncbi:MAG: hypothetical protein R2873_00875 [Caldilineaceae bacterium]|nr:hypothetical protein [Caldilineaceae bacterium]